MQLFIGFDVGGTHIKHGVIDENGNELTSGEFDTPDDKQSFKEQWKAVVDACRKEHEIVAIGVSFPGHINTHTGQAAKAGALDYLDDVNLCELFAELTDLPVTAENDANCAALGERWRGAGRDYESFVCITIGTGIGGGIVMDGELYRGSHYRAGEFGVIPVGNNGEYMHEVASASGLMKACRRALALPENEMPGGEELFARMESDVHLREAIEEWAHFLARGVYSVISMFDPQAVLIGGGISEQKKIYALMDKYLQRFEEWEALKVPILPCELGNQAGRLGAVWLAKQKLARG
ncbi:ROK family protein [Citrobacter rodentium]|jgi:Transcriptional regulator/sugar kinase|uniref:Sugar kinase n=2 Tax=Citrobacter rodentium TaxID=67825 RepID=D2TJS8_CITRI|nr:ROK family protein [Citrobacter rodentium]KIQ51642.1 sugar kinase [Citrobacter rodentium]QBY30515.1 ROK family protein [Citrobacter rodentium]UHO32114.1 ROK family protein [Citrobacter rodentium NBRC 105723 = DSM 16636]CBG90926.1 putative sugar kinase [Citrobacter rodentium ICC168]HAT8013087.1 ROK family protein [Citrobacter rodentium NBRC 105723 = DSM 16636]